jgi:hypothetical protein
MLNSLFDKSIEPVELVFASYESTAEGISWTGLLNSFIRKVEYSE